MYLQPIDITVFPPTPSLSLSPCIGTPNTTTVNSTSVVSLTAGQSSVIEERNNKKASTPLGSLVSYGDDSDSDS